MAVGFETGSNSSGYTLTSVRATLSDALPADGVRLQLFDAQLSYPNTRLFTFDNPTISDGTKRFTAPANTTLQKNRLYFLVFDSSATNAGYQVGTTESDSLTSAAAGWELNADRHFTLSNGGNWLTHYATLRVEINGTIKPNATGKPGITGIPQAGQSLTATIGDITDAEGLPAFPSGFTLQWVRVDGATETDIPGAMSSTYVPVAADVGKQLKVKVSYTDNAGAAEGPLESEPTDVAVLAARVPCPSRSDWCARMTVRHGIGTSVPLELGGGTDGALDDSSFEYGRRSYVVNAIWLLMDPLSATNAVAVTLDAFVPRGSVFHIGGAMFTADRSSEQAIAGQYLWSAPSGLSWIEGQKVTASVRFRRSSVTIAATNAEAVYGAEHIGFTVTRDGDTDTDGPLDVDVVLTDSRGHLPESALSRTITIPDGAQSATLTIPPDEFKDLNDGAWTVRPGTITGKIVRRSWYRLGSPSSVRVKMNYATTVGFGPFTSSFRVDEGTGSLDVTFYATTGEGMGAPTQRVEVQYSTAGGTATSPGDFRARSGGFFFEPSDFKCLPGGYDGCVLARDDHRATKTVTLTNIIKEDSSVEGDETFRLLLHKGASNPKSVVYVDDRGVRGVSCTPGETCAAEITIVDNDDITGPTEHPDWTLTGRGRVFAGTSSQHGSPQVSGTEASIRCLGGANSFTLTDHNGNPVTGAIAYSLHVADGYAGHNGITSRFDVPGMFTIGSDGQIRTKVGTDYPHGSGPDGVLRTIYANVRALHTATNRYAEYRQGFNIIHPNRTDFGSQNPTCAGEAQGLHPLTAELQNMPQSHDGSAFTFRIDFSDDLVDIDADEMRDHSLQVTGATVTSAAKVDSRDDLWELTLTPTGTDAVFVIIEANRDCAVDGALCASNGRMLTTGFVQALSYVAPQEQTTALTAAFESVPASHDGSNAFTMELAFSEAVFEGTEPFNKNARVRSALSVTGGTLANFRRTNPAVFDRWTLRIRPSGNGDVTLSLPPTTSCSAANAICTPGGTPLSGTTTATIQGPATLSVADATVEEGPDAALAFVITLSRAVPQAVTVDFATSDGSAKAGTDYTETSDRLTFAAGERAKTVSVPVIDDDHNEGSETLTLTLSNPSGGNAYIADGTATGTITNSDPMPQAWLARFGRTVADQVIDAVAERMSAAGTGSTELTLGGQRIGGGVTAEDGALDAAQAEAGLETLAAWLRGAEEDALGFETRAVTERELLTGSSFALSAGDADGGITSLWGRGAWSSFDGREGDLTLSGEVTSALIGADWTRERWTAGVMLSHARGEGSYRGASTGKVESTVTGLYPYGRYAMTDRVTVWGVAGYGAGTLTLEPEPAAGADPEDGRALRTDMDLTMAAAGLRGVVVQAATKDGPEVSVETDGLAVRSRSDALRSDADNLAAATGEATRLRLGLVTAWRGLKLAGGALEPRLEVGVRHDGGDAETGFGLDAGAGLAWSYPENGLQLQLSGRGLLTHESKGFREQGVAGSLTWHPRPEGGGGPKLTVTQTMGGSSSGGANALLGRRTLAGLAASDDGDRLESRSLEVRFGYGFAAFGGRFSSTPEFGFGMSNGHRKYSLGWRLNLVELSTSALEFGLEATRGEAVNDNAARPDHTAGFRLMARW